MVSPLNTPPPGGDNTPPPGGDKKLGKAKGTSGSSNSSSTSSRSGIFGRIVEAVRKFFGRPSSETSSATGSSQSSASTVSMDEKEALVQTALSSLGKKAEQSSSHELVQDIEKTWKGMGQQAPGSFVAMGLGVIGKGLSANKVKLESRIGGANHQDPNLQSAKTTISMIADKVRSSGNSHDWGIIVSLALQGPSVFHRHIQGGPDGINRLQNLIRGLAQENPHSPLGKDLEELSAMLPSVASSGGVAAIDALLHHGVRVTMDLTTFAKHQFTRTPGVQINGEAVQTGTHLSLVRLKELHKKDPNEWSKMLNTLSMMTGAGLTKSMGSKKSSKL